MAVSVNLWVGPILTDPDSNVSSIEWISMTFGGDTHPIRPSLDELQ